MQEIVAANGAVTTVTPLSIVSWTAEATRQNGTQFGDRTLAVIGEAVGGAPTTPYVFNNATDAAKVLLSGDLLKAIQYAFSSGAPDGARPRAIVAVNAKGGSPATFNVVDGAGTTVFSLTTLTYREPANQTTLTITGNKTTGFNLQIKDPVTSGALGYNRLGIGLFIQYVGGGSAASAEVVEVANSKYLRTTVTGGATGESLLIPLAGLTVRQLAQQVQQSGPYNVLTARSADLPADGLDLTTAPTSILASVVIGTVSAKVEANGTAITLNAAAPRALLAGETLRYRLNSVWRYVQVATNIPAGTNITILPSSLTIPAGTVLLDSSPVAPVALSAVKADFEDFLINKGFAIVQYTAGDDAATDPVPQSGHFAGGGSAVTTGSDWEAAVEAALEAEFGLMTAVTGDQGLLFGIRSRLQSARAPIEGRFIQFFAGVDKDFLPSDSSPTSLAAYQQTVSSLISSINDFDSVLVVQAADGSSAAAGRSETLEPRFVAAMLAGYAAAIGREKSTTYGTLALSNPFPNLKSLKNEFTLAGALVLTSTQRGGPARIELGRTTYVGDDNVIYEHEKAVRYVNSVASNIKALQENSIPGKADKASLAKFERDLTTYFEGQKSKGLIQDGIDQEGNEVKAYEFEVQRTSYQGRLITTFAKINPTLEYVAADFYLYARPVEIEV